MLVRGEEEGRGMGREGRGRRWPFEAQVEREKSLPIRLFVFSRPQQRREKNEKDASQI